MGIVPVAIRGTRAALPPGSLWLRPGRIDVELAPPQAAPASTQESDVTQARECARHAILERIPEPDLA
jgi:1-acyl-sn-glycerol-3-phosphate acyltransferase